MVNMKLRLWTDFLYNLVILIKLCKISYKNLDKALLFSRNHVFCLKIWKFWRAPTTLQFFTTQYFLLKLDTHFLLTNVYKRMRWIFFISFRSWVICKNLKRPGSYALVFDTFINDSRSKQNFKNPTHLFVDITK